MRNSKKIYLNYFDVDKYKKYRLFICELHREHLELNFPTQEFDIGLFLDDLENGGGKKLVVAEGNCPVGFVWIENKYNKYERCIEFIIRYIHVHEKFRSKGYGKKILNDMIEKYSDNAYRIVLGTHIDNKLSRNFYEKFGFEPYRIIYRKTL